MMAARPCAWPGWLALALAGCPSSPAPPAPPPSPTVVVLAPASAAAQAAASPGTPEPSAEPAPAVPAAERGAGEPCHATAECASGYCAGGCEDARCAPPPQLCTRDLRAYCGCDGRTFHASGSCPGRPYARRGPCEP
ncbi:MAG: hypothetical protein HY744_03160 [Deltaproteobacteria bacterium]|nr:hypothetical protein [Deltaproteobacteria bacterium]